MTSIVLFLFFEIFYRNPDLAHGIAFAQCGAMRLFQRVKVDGNAERDGDFVCAGVPASDGSARVVNSVRNVSESEIASCWISIKNKKINFNLISGLSV